MLLLGDDALLEGLAQDCRRFLARQLLRADRVLDLAGDRFGAVADEEGLLVLAQAQLAEQVGVSRQTIISLEANKYVPSLLLAMRLAHVFGVAVEDLFILDQDIVSGS